MVSGKDDLAALIDEGSAKAARWAIETLDLKVEPADPSYLKIQALKAQAAQLLGALKARVDPAAMRGGTKDVVGETIRKRIEKAKAGGD